MPEVFESVLQEFLEVKPSVYIRRSSVVKLSLVATPKEDEYGFILLINNDVIFLNRKEYTGALADIIYPLRARSYEE